MKTTSYFESASIETLKLIPNLQFRCTAALVEDRNTQLGGLISCQVTD